jgi:hypothetical protein
MGGMPHREKFTAPKGLNFSLEGHIEIFLSSFRAPVPCVMVGEQSSKFMPAAPAEVDFANDPGKRGEVDQS